MAPKRHLIKQGTPTMGGVIILVAVSLTCLLMGKLTTELVLVLLATLATGVLGLIDDLTSVTHGRSLGLTPHAKMIGLTLICVTFHRACCQLVRRRPQRFVSPVA